MIRMKPMNRPGMSQMALVGLAMMSSTRNEPVER